MAEFDNKIVDKLVDNMTDKMINKISEMDKKVENAETNTVNNIIEHSKTEIQRLINSVNREIKNQDIEQIILYSSDLLKFKDDLNGSKGDKIVSQLKGNITKTIKKAQDEVNKKYPGLELTSKLNIDSKSMLRLSEINEDYKNQLKIQTELEQSLSSEQEKHEKIKLQMFEELNLLKKKQDIENKMVFSKKTKNEVKDSLENFQWNKESKKHITKNNINLVISELERIVKLAYSGGGPASTALLTDQGFDQKTIEENITRAFKNTNFTRLKDMADGLIPWDAKFAKNLANEFLQQLKGHMLYNDNSLNADQLLKLESQLAQSENKINRIRFDKMQITDDLSKIKYSQKEIVDNFVKDNINTNIIDNNNISVQEKVNNTDLDRLKELLLTYSQFKSVGKTFDEVCEENKRSLTMVTNGTKTYEQAIVSVAKKMGGTIDSFRMLDQETELAESLGLKVKSRSVYTNLVPVNSQNFSSTSEVETSLMSVNNIIEQLTPKAEKIIELMNQLTGRKETVERNYNRTQEGYYGLDDFMGNREYQALIKELIKKGENAKAAFLYGWMLKNHPKTKLTLDKLGIDFELNYDKYYKQGEEMYNTARNDSDYNNFRIAQRFQHGLEIEKNHFSGDDSKYSQTLTEAFNLSQKLSEYELNTLESRQKNITLLEEEIKLLQEEASLEYSKAELLQEEFQKIEDIHGFESKKVNNFISKNNLQGNSFLEVLQSIYAKSDELHTKREELQEILNVIISIDDISKSTFKTKNALNFIGYSQEEFDKFIEIINFLKSGKAVTPGGINSLLNSLGLNDSDLDKIYEIITRFLALQTGYVKKEGNIIPDNINGAGLTALSAVDATRELLGLKNKELETENAITETIEKRYKLAKRETIPKLPNNTSPITNNNENAIHNAEYWNTSKSNELVQQADLIMNKEVNKQSDILSQMYKDAINTIISRFIENIRNALNSSLLSSDQSIINSKDVNDNIGSHIISEQNLLEVTERTTDSLEKQEEELKQDSSATENATESTERLVETTKKISEEANKASLSEEKEAKKLSSISESATKAATSKEEVTKANKELEKSIDPSVSAMEKEEKEMNEFTEATKKTNKTIWELIKTSETYNSSRTKTYKDTLHAGRYKVVNETMDKDEDGIPLGTWSQTSSTIITNYKELEKEGIRTAQNIFDTNRKLTQELSKPFSDTKKIELFENELERLINRYQELYSIAKDYDKEKGVGIDYQGINFENAVRTKIDSLSSSMTEKDLNILYATMDKELNSVMREYNKRISNTTELLEKTGNSQLIETLKTQISNTIADLRYLGENLTKEDLEKAKNDIRSFINSFDASFGQIKYGQNNYFGTGKNGDLTLNSLEEAIAKAKQLASERGKIIKELSAPSFVNDKGIAQFSTTIEDLSGKVQKLTFVYNQASGQMSVSSKNIGSQLRGLDKVMTGIDKRANTLFTYWFARLFDPIYWISYIKRILNSIRELDTALVDLRKALNMVCVKDSNNKIVSIFF